jgi:hypothetical protein
MGKLIDAIKKEKKERAEQEKKQKAASLTPQLPSYSNVLAKNNDKYGLSAARTEKSFDVQPTKKLSLIEQIKREKTSANADSIIDRLNTWYKNNNNFMSNYQTRFSGLTGTYDDPYDSEISDWLSTVTEQKSRFDAEADSILSYLTANSDLFDEEWLNATITNLNFTRKQQEDILKNTENINKHWSQFADENEYLGYQNEYQKQKRYEGYQSKYEGKSYEDIVSALGTMQDGEEKDWLKNESLMRYDLDAGQEEIGRLTSILDVKNQITAIKQEESTLKLAIAKGDKNAAEKLAKNNQRLEALNSTWEHALSTYGSEDNLNSLLSSKRAEYTTAERAQKAAELALVADETSEVYDPKFSTYSELGKHISYENVGSTKNQNGIAIYDDLKAATLALNEHQLGTELYTEDMMLPGDGISGYLQGLKGISEYNSENNDTVKTFRKMNESEFAILAYYLKKDEENGTDLAAQYIASIKQTLNTRVAMDIAKEKEGNLALQYVFAVEAGLDQFYEGRDAWRSGEDSIVPSATQIASGIIREDLAETGAKLPDWLGGASLGQVGYDAITTTSNMLPSILVSTVGNAALPGVGTIAGAGVLGMSAGGNAKAEMLRLGYSEDQATSYGLMVGIAEAGMEYLLGHIPGLSKGDGLFSTLGTKVASKVDNAISRVAISLGDKGTDILKAAASRAIGAVGGALDEALEEGLQTIIEPWLKEVATSVDWEDPKVDEVLYSSLLGAITSFGFSAGETVIDGVRYPAVQNAEAKKNLGAYQGEIASEVVALNPNDSFAKNMQAKVESGKDLSGSQLNRLVKNYESTLTQNDVEKIKSATVNRLNELGESGDVEVIASALTKQATGKKLSSKEQKVIESSTFGQRVANELNPENIKSRGYTSAWAENIGTDRINVKEYNKDLMESEDAPTRVTVGGKTAAAVVLKNAEGKTVKAEIEGVEAEGEKATFKLSNGEKVGIDKVAFKSDNEKLVADIAVERVSRVDGFTNEAAMAMIKGYDGSISPAKYMTAFDEAYEMGANGTPSSKLTGVINSGVSERVAFTAYVLGEQSTKNVESVLNSEAKNGIINTNINESEAGYESGENLHLRNSGERVGSQNTQGQVPRVEGGAGQAESRGKTARIADSEAARLVNEGREVKVADLGILGGSTEQTVRLVDKASETSSMQEARKNAEARGLKVKFFVGDNLVIKDSGGKWISARAYIKGEHVFIRADHPLYTADQLMRHELGHDMIAKGEVNIAAVRERLKETVGEENIDEVARLYSDAYAGTGMSADEIWEECICDSLGDMNIFAGVETIGEFFDLALPEIKAVASETKSPTQTRGSPEAKASRAPRQGRSTEIVTMENNRFDRLREFRDALPNMWYARTYDYFYVYSNRSFTEYTIIKKIKITDANSQLINAIEGALKDEINGDTKTFNDWLESFRSRKRSHSGNNANASRGGSAGPVDGMDGGARRSEAGNDPSGSNGNSHITEEIESKYSSPEEAKASGKVSDAKFSIEFADDIANKQRQFAADGLSRISSEELEKAIADTAHMVNEMKPYANILPQDKVGKTLVKNGSYDVSVENTTICIRTLAYNSFVDMVSEKVGRPLTQMESFLVSQKLYEIAKEPQCLYCYVSLDRKAFNEMVIRYTEQRDAAIAAYEAAGKPQLPKKFDAEWSLFKEFLAGRKPTANMWDRYTGWINAYNKGDRLVSLSDISTEAKRLELVEGGGEIASQVKDILKYAQSASWAKKQTNYVAYYDEILKLKPAVIRNLNNHYGMRWYSFSDYSGAFIVENMQQITDAAIRGLKGLSYTKDTDFAEIFAPTGMNINISVYAKKTESGYEIDAKQSANIEEAIKLREQYPNVGIVVVATDKAGVEWALEQEWSDVVIPFHTVRTGADVAEFYNWEIFNAEQNDTVSDQNLWDAYTRDVGKKRASKMVYPSEHQNNRETYLSICEKRGLTPRFKSFLGNPNYMKLVNETRQSESQTSPLKAVYNLEAAERSFDKFVEKGGYYEGWYNDGIDVDGEADIVAEDVRAGKKANEVGYGRQDVSFEDVAKGRKTNRQHGKASMELDTEYLAAVDRGDTEAAQKMVDEAAKAAGYNIKAYHGSNAEFTVFDKNRVGKGNDQYGAGFYFASNADVTDLYGKNRYDTYLNIKKPVRLISKPGDHGNPLYNARITQTQAYQILKRHPLMYDPENSPLGDFYEEYWNGGAKEWMVKDLAKKYNTIGALDGDVVLYRDYPNELHEAIRDVIGYDGVVVYFESDNMYDERNDYYYVAWFDNQMKSADPVAYDDDGNVIPLSERFNSEKNDIRYSRELDFIDYTNKESERELLANALESVAQNDVEKSKLNDYKENIGKLNAEEEKLQKLRGEIKELSFGKGPRDLTKIAQLREEAEKTANRINIYDKRLLNLEASKPLLEVLKREKQKAYKRAEAEGRAALDEYRARAQRSHEELKTRYQESKKRGVEGRHKTEVRHKIQGIVGELNTLLLNPTAKKHIKEELRRGVAEALSAFNMDTVGAEERLAEINRKLQKESDPYEIEHLLESYRRIQNQGANLKEKLEKLESAYKNIKDSDDIELNLAYQEVIQNSIKAVSEKVGDTSIRDMTLEQLEMVYDLFKMIRHTIRDANKAFKTKKGETITQMAEMANHEVRTVGGQPYQRNVVSATLQRRGWTVLKPYVAFRTIGSETLVDRYRELREGEDTFYADIREAQTFIEEQYEKYGFKSWDMKETKEFKSKSGKSFELTLEQMMTLYAYSKREQAHAHIMEGGIVFEDALVVKKNKLGVPVKYEVTTKDAFNLSVETFTEIASSLTDEQKAYVDAMQAYLSDNMGAKGNEVSMQLLGVKLFKEKFYLPIKSSQYYMNFKAEEAGEVKLRSPAFSKETVHHANNPIVLHNFTDLWAEHINDMAMYHSFVLALEDFTRVYNYKTRTDANVETMDTKATLETAYPGVTEYINKFLKDMNGGVRGETVGWAERMTSLAKKGAVLGSASVTIQQPSAIMRAMAYINPKYFVGEKVTEGNHKQKWEELKKYAPIAGIKEMGRFDVGMGQSTADWIKADKNILEKAEDVLSLPPAFMDEVTWLAIWDAVKRETAHNYPKLATGSEEFKTLAGERFTDVISLSQVYDSVFSRSDIMRNKSWIAKSLTSFMAEPMTTLNMLWDSAVQGKRTGSKKGFVATTAATGGAVFAAIFVNSLLKSFVMAMRDDDEDESYIEKYLEHFVGDFKDNLNPLNLIPFVKDIWSIFKGYDVERMDMALFSDLKNAIDAFDSDNKTLYEKWMGLIGAVAAFRGVPIKNVERDVRALYNTLFGKREETTLEGMLYAIEKGWSGEEKSNGQQLYEAMLNGDAKHIVRLRARFEDQDAIDAAVYKALKENDVRVKEAARSRSIGDIAGYTAIAKEIVGEGIFTQDNVVSAINSEIRAFSSKITEAANAKLVGEEKEYKDLLDKLIETYDGVYSREEIEEAIKVEMSKPQKSTDSDEIKSIYVVEDFYKAIRGNDLVTAYAVREDLIGAAVDNGKSRKAAESAFESSIASFVGDQYRDALIGDSEAKSMLTLYGGLTDDEARTRVRYWAFKLENPEYDDLSESAVNKYYDGSYKDGELYGKSAESYGITLDVYAEYVRGKSGLTKKEDIMYIINTLPLSKEQKDALYYLNTNWSKNEIRKSPWR